MTTQTTAVHSLAISGRITLDLHALNNEGSEGNQLNARQVYIVTSNGHNPITARVNAISGDMLKHIQVDYFRRLAQQAGLPLSQGAQLAHPNRIGLDLTLTAEGKRAAGAKDAGLLDYIITTCSLTDAAGILITGKGRSTSRKSLVEFGWTVGLPNITKTESFLHTKYVSDSGDASAEDEAANQGQNIFHRPASSGIYATVCHVELSRLGYNDISQCYPAELSDEARQRRCTVLLESVLYTFLQVDGAHRNTQAPHVVGFEGVITTSKKMIPAPAFSSLQPEYQQQVARIADSLNKLHPDAISSHHFDSMAQFTEVMSDLIATTAPARLPEFKK